MINDELLEALEEKFGRRIRYAKDCDVLANDILKSTGCRLSVSTLKRLLGFGESYFIPRLYTLDTIAKYLGFNSWNQVPIIGANDLDDYQEKFRVTFTNGDALILTRFDANYSRIIWHSFTQNPHIYLIAVNHLVIGGRLKLFHAELGNKYPRVLLIKSMEII